jgi:choline dehydrogenase-like flavoprotein
MRIAAGLDLTFDVVVIGVGKVGSIVAKELAAAGGWVSLQIGRNVLAHVDMSVAVLGETHRLPLEFRAVLVDCFVVVGVRAREPDHPPRDHVAIAAIDRRVPRRVNPSSVLLRGAGAAACAVDDNSAVAGTTVAAPTVVTNERRVTFSMNPPTSDSNAILPKLRAW